MPVIIEVKNLSKTFRDLKAVDDLSFSVSSGKVYGFLGQNGAGKSTTIRMLLTLIRPDEGTIELFGKDLQHHRKEILNRIGAIIEKPDLYKYLTAIENLRIFGILSGIKLSRSELLRKLEYVGLASRADSKVKTFSQGMKQRLGLAVALVNNPELIILDEPTNGLDPQGIADIRNLIMRLSSEEKKTVFISSHLLSEMEIIADSLLIINKGKKLVEGEMSELINPFKTKVELSTSAITEAVSYLQHSVWTSCFRSAEDDTIVLEMNKNDIPALNRDLVNNNIPVFAIRPVHTLEDYFLSKTTN
jgi:ABC-2 type transport system ATP-binding protein